MRWILAANSRGVVEKELQLFYDGAAGGLTENCCPESSGSIGVHFLPSKARLKTSIRICEGFSAKPHLFVM